MENTKVTIFRGGTKQKTVAIKDLVIPDLWELSEAIKQGTLHESNREDAAKQIRDCWHICGALKYFILDIKEPTPLEAAAPDLLAACEGLMGDRCGREMLKSISPHLIPPFEQAIAKAEKH